MRISNLLLFIAAIAAFGCGSTEENNRKAALPIYGNFTLEEGKNGEIDTLYHTIGNFSFYNQDSTLITEKSTLGKVYVADFFFTSCQEICIPMAGQMLRVHEAYANNTEFMILSHSIDPEFDTVPELKKYANKLDIPDSTNWHFLTGQLTNVFELGEKKYMVTAHEDNTAPGGVLHSGHFLLVDRKGRIRGVYDGTDPNAVDQLIAEIKILL